MKPFAYTLSYIFPVLTVITLFTGGWSLLLVPVITFGLVPFMELFFSGVTDNVEKSSEKDLSANVVYDWLLYL